MKKNSRAARIYAAGLAEYPDGLLEDNEVHTLKAIAAMIAEATAKPKKKKVCGHVCDESCQEELPKMVYDEKALLSTLPEPLAVAKYGRLNRVLRTLKLEQSDLAQFEAWFKESMLPWLESKDIPFTYAMLVKKYPEWVEKSRQYGSVVAATPSVDAWR